MKIELPEGDTSISQYLSVKDFDGKIPTRNIKEEEKHCNVGVNKDWENSDYAKNLKKIYSYLEDEKFTVSQKSKRIEFEFTPKTFWQLTPSIAINLSMKEVEFVWFCFGMYINWK